MTAYKGYEIEKIIRNTYCIRKDGELIETRAYCDGRFYPKTIKESKAIIDRLVGEEK